LLLTFALLGCLSPKRSLIVLENDSEIDLTELDSVRENLNGFWIPEDEIRPKNILWLDFHETKNFTYWETIPNSKKTLRTGEFPVESCPTIVSLIKVDGKTQLKFVGLTSSGTAEIEYLTRTKFKIYGTTYLRHRGFDL